jgi:hypothetical protein
LFSVCFPKFVLNIHFVCQQYIDRSEQETHLLAAVEYPNLKSGFGYILRTRGGNVAGLGSWSGPSVSTCTMATIPSAPSTPQTFARTLRSLTFQWTPPHEDGGSAIIGYRIHLKNIDKEIELPRTSVSYTWDGLFPGRSYFVRVLAVNVKGISEYSDFNSESESYTLTASPDIPQNPLAVSGTSTSLTFEASTPFHNGSPITFMQVEKRTVSPFDVGVWLPVLSPSTRQSVRSIRGSLLRTNFVLGEKSRDVKIVEFVDVNKQQEEMEEKVKGLEMLKAKLGFSNDRKTAARLEADIEEMINTQVCITLICFALTWYHFPITGIVMFSSETFWFATQFCSGGIGTRHTL